MIILKKFNNKGFVLVETLVVSVFVLIIFVLIFRNGIPMIEEYKIYENYDDIDSLYTANLIKETIKKNRSDFSDFYVKIIETMQSNLNNDDFSYIDLTDCKNRKDREINWPDVNLCETIKLRAGITEDDIIFLTYSDPSKIKNAKVLGNNRRYNEYIDYLSNMYDSSIVEDPYMIIVSRTIKGNNPYLTDEEQAQYKDYKIVKYGSIGFQ